MIRGLGSENRGESIFFFSQMGKFFPRIIYFAFYIFVFVPLVGQVKGTTCPGRALILALTRIYDTFSYIAEVIGN